MQQGCFSEIEGWGAAKRMPYLEATGEWHRFDMHFALCNMVSNREALASR